MPARYNLTWNDYSGEKSSFGLYFPSPSGAAFDWDSFITSVEDVGDALEILSNCVLDGEQIAEVMNVTSGLPSAIATAQREVGIRVFYHDNVTGKRYHFTIPGPAVAEYPPQGTDDIPLSNPNMASLVTLLEADCVSELGNAITVDKAKLVGRRS